MARYYFHVRRGQTMIIDQEGVELGDRTEAIKEGARPALQIEAREALLDVPQGEGIVIVESESSTVIEVPFGRGVRLWAANPGSHP